MNFTKQFKEDYVYCGNIDLPWDKVSQDLAQYSSDRSRTATIVDTEGSYGDELNSLQQEYATVGYNKMNTEIWKTTNIEPTLTFSWESFIISQLPLDYAIATVTRQDPGQVLPWHKDRFFMLRKLHPIDPRPVWRFLVFLEDWKIGHILQVNNSMLHHWKAGDVAVWQPGTMHLAANVGLEQKWTCNVTGFLNND